MMWFSLNVRVERRTSVAGRAERDRARPPGNRRIGNIRVIRGDELRNVDAVRGRRRWLAGERAADHAVVDPSTTRTAMHALVGGERDTGTVRLRHAVEFEHGHAAADLRRILNRDFVLRVAPWRITSQRSPATPTGMHGLRFKPRAAQRGFRAATRCRRDAASRTNRCTRSSLRDRHALPPSTRRQPMRTARRDTARRPLDSMCA